eukprot:30802-Pelagococcus_subviridis.AAC.14
MNSRMKPASAGKSIEPPPTARNSQSYSSASTSGVVGVVAGTTVVRFSASPSARSVRFPPLDSSAAAIGFGFGVGVGIGVGVGVGAAASVSAFAIFSDRMVTLNSLNVAVPAPSPSANVPLRRILPTRVRPARGRANLPFSLRELELDDALHGGIRRRVRRVAIEPVARRVRHGELQGQRRVIVRVRRRQGPPPGRGERRGAKRYAHAVISLPDLRAGLSSDGPLKVPPPLYIVEGVALDRRRVLGRIRDRSHAVERHREILERVVAHVIRDRGVERFHADLENFPSLAGRRRRRRRQLVRERLAVVQQFRFHAGTIDLQRANQRGHGDARLDVVPRFARIRHHRSPDNLEIRPRRVVFASASDAHVAGEDELIDRRSPFDHLERGAEA